MRIKVIIYAIVMILMVLFLSITTISSVLVGRVDRMSSDLYEVRLQSIDLLIEADRDSYQSNQALTLLLLLQSSGKITNDRMQSGLDSVAENTAQVHERYSKFDKLMMNEPAEIRTLIDSFYPLEDKWKSLTEDLVLLISNGDWTQALDIYDSRYESVFQPMRDVMDQLTGYSLDAAQANYHGILKFGKFLKTFYFILTAAGLLMGLFIVLVVSRKILKPIEQVSHHVMNLSSGEGDLTQRLPVEGNDEMADLSQHTNLFIEKTEHIMIGLREAVVSANNQKDGIVSSIEENSAASTQIAANVKSIAGQVENLDREVNHVNRTAEDVKASVDLFEEQVSNQATMVAESTASVTEMIASIANLSRIAVNRREGTARLSETINKGNIMVQESSDAVGAIHDDIDSILEMTKLIAGIASQTNLLAMNAAIEAAHAGNAGRGFAVVADEIRKLAETSSQQSTSINNVLKQIVHNIQNAREASGFTSQIYREILDEFHILSQAFEEISSNSLELDAGGKQILEAMEQLQEQSALSSEEAVKLKESNSEISTAISKLSSISLSVDEAVKEILQGMDEIAASMEDLGQISTELDRNMSEAGELAGRFKVNDYESETAAEQQVSEPEAALRTDSTE